MKVITCLALLVAGASLADAPFEDSLIVRGDVKIEPGTYELTTPIRIVENGSRLDLTGVVLSSPEAAGPAESFTDTAIVIEGLQDVTVVGAILSGFKLGIAARGCTGLIVTGCDVSGNYRQRLYSTPERENEADWLWPHHNDENEWAANYGAGIYLDRCQAAEVAGNTGHNSQNGIVLSRTVSSFVYDNDMSFMSGWGLAMWRSSGNEVSNNRFDYCVRGYSDGVYRRGQDSAGILVFEQCSDNVFAFNSATHGGDGFFLYAGHETVEQTGQGGSNRNLLYRNDFSYAVANGIEATFSEGNRFIENTLNGCEYGIWAGYSRGTEIVGNRIERCVRAGIAIEHGHDNRVEENSFEGNRVGLQLWAFPSARFDTLPFGRNQNTHSERYRVARNRFVADSTSIRLHNTSEAVVEENEFSPVGIVLALKSVCPLLRFRCNNIREGKLLVTNESWESVTLGANYSVVWAMDGEVVAPDTLSEPLPPDTASVQSEVVVPHVRGSMDTSFPAEMPRGRDTILMGDFGPLSVGVPHLFPLQPSSWGRVKVFLVGAAEYFSVNLVGGPVYVEPLAGRIPSSLVARPMRQGFATSSVQIGCGEQVFNVNIGLASSEWVVRFFSWGGSATEGPPLDWDAIVLSEPVDTMHTDAIDFWWGGEQPTDQVPSDYFATVGETSLNLPAGTYRAHVIADDGVRLLVDGRAVLTRWASDFVRHDEESFVVSTGVHRFRIEHFQTQGSSWLQLWLCR